MQKEVVLVADATFLGKRKDKFGVLVFKDSVSGRVIAFRFIDTEKISYYIELYEEIISQGYDVKSVTVDGRKGLFQAFRNTPVQMCHFHQKMIVTRYLTKTPRLKASIDLKRICSYLGKATLSRFKTLLDAWYKRHNEFLEEKTLNHETGKYSYTHRRLRSAYRSLKTNLKYLFSYRNYPDVNIPNTTNMLDGGVFSPLKTLLRIHRGVKKELKEKIIADYLYKTKKKE